MFLAPFSAALWITIACSPFFVALVLTVIAKLTPLGIYNIVRTRQINHHTGPHPVEEHAVEAGTILLPKRACAWDPRLCRSHYMSWRCPSRLMTLLLSMALPWLCSV